MRNDGKWYRWQDETLVLSLLVQPRAKRDELLDPERGHLKVWIKAPPVEGKANEQLRRFLASEFGVPRSRVELVAGARARLKRVRIRTPRKLPNAIKPKPHLR